MGKIKSFFIDILMVSDPEKKGDHHFSQSRIYLLISLIVLLGMVISSYFLTEPNENFQHALDNVFWLNVLFASYALVGKGLSYDKLKSIVRYKSSIKDPKKAVEKVDEKLNNENQELA